jgi:perosamine synthetase
MSERINQIEPWIDDDEWRELEKVIRSTFITENSATRLFESGIRELTGAKHAVAMANGTMALFSILRVAGIGAGDEVIVPDMTFVATANAVILTGATPVVCDVRADTFCIDVDKAEKLVTPRTKAIIPVHLYGLAAELDGLREFCGRRELLLIEDAAQGVGVRYKGQHVGTFGQAGMLSFYGNKTMTTGEGGIVLTDDDRIAAECYKLKNHGRPVKGIFVHESVGFNFSFTDLQAAVGIAQLAKLPRIIANKAAIRDHYRQALDGVGDLEFQSVPDHTDPVYWFTNIYTDHADDLGAFLADRGVGTRRFFYPLHRQPCYSDRDLPTCPVSNAGYERALSLPSTATITADQLEGVTANVVAFFG